MNRKLKKNLKNKICILRFTKEGKQTRYCIAIVDKAHKGWRPVACFNTEKEAQDNLNEVVVGTLLNGEKI